VKDEPGTEIEHLRAEVSQLRGDLRRDRVEKHQERIETRTTPPLSGMTRIQKRYFLEPWFTTIMIGAWTIAAVLVGVGLWFGARLIVLGGLFTIIGVGQAWPSGGTSTRTLARKDRCNRAPTTEAPARVVETPALLRLGPHVSLGPHSLVPLCPLPGGR
jgi:hypothetical protein